MYNKQGKEQFTELAAPGKTQNMVLRECREDNKAQIWLMIFLPFGWKRRRKN